MTFPERPVENSCSAPHRLGKAREKPACKGSSEVLDSGLSGLGGVTWPNTLTYQNGELRFREVK